MESADWRTGVRGSYKERGDWRTGGRGSYKERGDWRTGVRGGGAPIRRVLIGGLG